MQTTNRLSYSERLAYVEAGLSGRRRAAVQARPLESTAAEVAEQQGLVRLARHANHPDTDVSLPAMAQLMKMDRADLIGIG